MPSSPLSPPDSSPVWLRFALFCTLFMLAALWLEPYMAPLCRATAVQVGATLRLAGYVPYIHGDLITLQGFTVQIVTECTSLYACLLYGAFVLAQPTSWGPTIAGLLLGAMDITTANLLRISFVTAAGPVVSPLLFDILHVYLGQVAMLMLVVAAALVWLRWSTGGRASFPFLLRAGFIATVLFVPWLAVNRMYVELIDAPVAVFFSRLYPGYQLLTPRPYAIYNHTFAVPLFLALMMAGRSDWTWRRRTATVAGICVIAGWHSLFRVSHVVWTALDVPEIIPLHQLIYLLGQFLLPFLLWLRQDGRTIWQVRASSHIIPGKPVILALLLAVCWSSTALAEPVVLIHPIGRGGFSIKADNLNRVVEAEIRVDYQSEDKMPPQVSGAGLGAQATIAVQADNPGSFTIRLKSSKPLSGHVLLATARIQGSVTFLTAWLRNDKGMTETPRISIKNPTDEELSAMASQRPTTPPSVAAPPAVIAPASAVSADATTTGPSVSPAETAATVHPPEQDYESRLITFNRRTSVLEKIRAYSGGRTPAAFDRLFENSDDMFSQEPPVLLSDGTASLRLTVRAANSSSRSPQFLITGGSCTGLQVNDDGAWVLEIVPEQGSLASSVSVLTGGDMIEYPLTVAPPLDLYDGKNANPGEAEYVATANRLAVRAH